MSILSSRERESVKGKIDGRSYRQIADSLGISVSAVGVLLSRARAKLEGGETYEQKNKAKINARRRTQGKRKTMAQELCGKASRI